MPRHTWTVRIELCETYDAVFAHAFLENGSAHLAGHGKANVGDISTAVASRGAAARRALADLSQAMLAAQEHTPVPVPAPGPAGLEPALAPAPAHLRVPAPAPGAVPFTGPGPEPVPLADAAPSRVYSLSLAATSLSLLSVAPAVAG